jgi:predicted adenylyl cyclase CyaB
MFEMELKAKINGLESHVFSALSKLAYTPALDRVYSDTYWDNGAGELAASGRELRTRSPITAPDASATALCTFKTEPFDVATDSRRELEVTVSDSATFVAILSSIGFAVTVSFAKRCRTFSLVYAGFDVLATIATVPESDDIFLEIEALVPTLAAADEAKRSLFSLLDALDVPTSSLTTVGYISMVQRARSGLW